MLESGTLANECCCSVVPTVPDLTPIMRSLSEALHYINAENGLNPEFGGAQGDAWPNQREFPFLPAPADGEDIPPDFYENDYLADIQNSYDDLQTIINNYNYVKNFFLKTDPFAGASSLANYTGADDYNPGVINAGNFDAIRAAIVVLTNDILNVMIQAASVVDCCKGAIATNVSSVADWANRQNCAESSLDGEECGESTNTEDVGVDPSCTFVDIQECNDTVIGCVEYTSFDLTACDNCFAALSVVSGHINVNLTNFLSADQAGIYLKLTNDVGLPFSVPATKPIANDGVYELWQAPTLGVNYDSGTVTGSDQKIPFSFAGPTPACTGGIFQSGTSWRLDDQVAILTRAQTHVAS